ncbi:MAG: phage replisome organizer N-terminal domain-containing protein [Candidatus Bathyarchaeia archaeon]
MKKRAADQFWFPFWVDKWIFGSMRIECTLEERAIWVDLLALASKDEGYIRANEETPYPLQQLAGMLIVPEETLKKAINKFVKLGKIKREKNKTLYVAKWDKYQFSDRWKREVEKDSSAKTEVSSKKTEPIIDNSTLEDNKVEDNTYTEEFSFFWDYYNNKVAKKDALKAYTTLMRMGETHERIMNAAKGYFNHLRNEKVYSNFEKAMMYPATFLRNEKYKDFLGVKYNPPM